MPKFDVFLKIFQTEHPSEHTHLLLQNFSIFRGLWHIYAFSIQVWIFSGILRARWRSWTKLILFFWCYTFSLKKWRWSKNGLHGSWENSGRTSLRSVERILSSPSLARNRPCVYCQIQTRRARWGGSTVSGKQIRYFHNNNTSFFKFLRGSRSALKNLKYFL